MPLVPESDSKPIAKLRVLHIISSLGDGGAEGVLYRLCCQTQKPKTQLVDLLIKVNNVQFIKQWVIVSIV